MEDPENGNVIVFNGEVYNHLELRVEIEAAATAAGRKQTWRGTSDTETILAGFGLWGEEVVARLRGMFALIIFDSGRNRIVAARDPLGIKPLYYERNGGSLRFASEIRALARFGTRTCTREGLSLYLQWGSCPESRFIFPGIEMVPAGHLMLIASDGSSEVRRYWPVKGFQAVAVRTLREAPERVRQLLERAVEHHLLSDVPVASFLSGGIDSSIVTAIAACRLGKRRLRTFSVGFPYQEFDETSVAADVARRYETEHERIEVSDEEAISLVQEAVGKMDAPSVDAINTYIVSKKVADLGIKVALSGLGADELFGGYPSFRDTPKLRLVSALPKAVRKTLSIFGRLGRRLADVPDGDAFSLAIWRRRLWGDEKLRLAGLPIATLETDPPPELPDSFSQISWAELSVYMRQMLLRDSDQMSMAVSLELRVPFLDRDLVEYVLRLPEREKTRHSGTKGLLVEACREMLPEHVYDRPKMGFSLPMDVWMRGALRDFSKAGLEEVERLALLAPGSIQQMQREFDGGEIHWTRLWSLVVLGHYLKKLSVNTGYESAVLAPA